MTTPLGERLAARIAVTGPMTLAEYMTECLHHPRDGYYATRDPLGAAGDFVTAPEISQMFGECLGLALAQAWLDRGAPAPAALAELGPGRGTLMADILRATARVPGFHAALKLHLVESSPALRAVQADRLGAFGPVWHDDVSTLPDLPLFLVANEFFDALPVRQFLRSGGGWRERVVGLQDGTLAFGLTDAAPVAALAARLPDTTDGDMVELCAPAAAIAGEVGRRIAAQGGVALIVDYGGWGGTGDTFQAVRGHRKVDPLATPGDADLTAHVDFAALAQAAAPALSTPMIPQGVLLERLGISARAEALRRAAPDPAVRSAIAAAHRRLTHPDEMGSLFQALALHAPGTPPPPGFER
jgi:NADH dehydrogenase [ubiquinone] 1 alpha subcomplex assembly factor 7